MNRQTSNNGNTKITALYSRFSVDDDVNSESGSITTQKMILADYAAKNGFSNIVHFTDEGWSGTNFERPTWKKLMAQVEAGNVANIILKDMTRFGRDHVQVGVCMDENVKHKLKK
jgi:DNA invertase Pin-like site-specific DNA recombinase